jgi:ferritin-like metal-binding protein YciE
MHGQETIIRYLQDSEAAERNFEDALASFSKMGSQRAVQNAFEQMSQVARTQHEQLRARIQTLGGEASTGKSALAHVLAFAPTMVQVGQAESEKNTQHLMIVIAAAAAEAGMYEALATAAKAAGDGETEQLARNLQQEENGDYQTASALLRDSALDSFQRSEGTSTESIQSYLEDAIAAEKTFETQLRDFGKEGSSNQIHALFLQHADETRRQYERLTARLKELGGDSSTAKSFIAHLVGLSPKLAQVGHDIMDRMTQNLIMAYAVENCEIAMYESLITVAESVGDAPTAELARSIQAEENATAEKLWKHIAPMALSAFDKMAGAEQLAR